MAKVTPISLITKLSGKLCKSDDTYFATNRQSGRIHAVKMNGDAVDNPTPAQLEARTKFVERTRNTTRWISANSPSDEFPLGTELYQKMLAAYKSQHKIGTFFGFVASRMSEDGTPSIG